MQMFTFACLNYEKHFLRVYYFCTLLRPYTIPENKQIDNEYIHNKEKQILN